MADGHAENDLNRSAAIRGVGIPHITRIFNPFTSWNSFGAHADSYGLVEQAKSKPATEGLQPKPPKKGIGPPPKPKGLVDNVLSVLRGNPIGQISKAIDVPGTPDVKKESLRGKLALKRGVVT